MGQCTSRKETGSLTKRATFISHIKPTKMDKHNKNLKANNDEESKKKQVPTNETCQLLDTNKKPQPKYSKGVAMSFGFKRRSMPMTTNNGPAPREADYSGTTATDPSGKEETTNFPIRNPPINKERSMHKTAFSQKPTSITYRPTRFGFHQPTDRTNKVGDLKTAPSPTEFGSATPNANNNKLISPTTEVGNNISNDKRTTIFTRNNAAKTDSGVETRKAPTDNNENSVNKDSYSPTEFEAARQNTYKTKATSPGSESDMSNERRFRTFTRTASKTDTVGKVRSFRDNNENTANKTVLSPNGLDEPPQETNKNRLTSPTVEFGSLSNDKRTRTFIRSVVKPESAEKCRISGSGANIMERLAGPQIQTGKYTFQTTRLPQPEPIRVIETKTAKTIANNNKRFQRIRRQFEEASRHTDTLTEDSGFGSNTSGHLGENDHTINYRNINNTVMGDNYAQSNFRSSNILSLMENSDSLSETSTPPPLPELPSVFYSNSPKSTNSEKGYFYKGAHESVNKSFIKLGTQRTFLKSRITDTDSSVHSSSDNDWINGGEAMAEDTSLLLSPKHNPYESKDIPSDRRASTCVTVVEAALHTLVKPSVTLELTDNFQSTKKSTILEDEDPQFTAVVANSLTGPLLDEEILSPVESLLSCSETEELLKKKLTRSSSDSKDINEKLTPASPDTPSNATYSLSLSDDKEDFLIDDEIADQPELVFEEGTINNVDHVTSRRFKDRKISTNMMDSTRNLRVKDYEIEASPVVTRKRRDFLRSMTGSFDSLSPCESIASDDLMMEYDISESNNVYDCDRRSGSFSSLEDTSKYKFKTEETFLNKNLFKNISKPTNLISRTGTPNYIKDSPRSIKSQLTNQSSQENRSPKRNPLQQLGYSSMAYDPTSDCLMLTKSNHSAIQQDIIAIKTMSLTLKRILNESATQNSLDNDAQVCPYENNTGLNNNNNNNNEFKIELADLRRQVIFLQGQLEDKEKTVNNLQKQIGHLANQNTQIVVDTPLFIPLDIRDKCNAATQTDRIRPISSGSLTLSSSMEDSGEILRLLLK